MTMNDKTWYLEGDDLDYARDVRTKIESAWDKIQIIAFRRFIDILKKQDALVYSKDLSKDIHYDYWTTVHGNRVDVCLRGKWWDDGPDPLRLNDVLFPETDAMINIELETGPNRKHVYIYNHKVGAKLTTGWKEEEKW